MNNGNGGNGRRRWFHPRRSDLAFAVGAAVFLWNGMQGNRVDPAWVYASLALMGFSVAGRFDK